MLDSDFTPIGNPGHIRVNSLIIQLLEKTYELGFLFQDSSADRRALPALRGTGFPDRLLHFQTPDPASENTGQVSGNKRLYPGDRLFPADHCLIQFCSTPADQKRHRSALYHLLYRYPSAWYVLFLDGIPAHAGDP